MNLSLFSELVLSVADSSSRQLLVSYQIPLTFLQTFHHYHLNLVTVSQCVYDHIQRCYFSNFFFYDFLFFYDFNLE